MNMDILVVFPDYTLHMPLLLRRIKASIHGVPDKLNYRGTHYSKHKSAKIQKEIHKADLQ